MRSSTSEQRASKLAQVSKVLGENGPPITWRAASSLGYRRRIRLRVDANGRIAFFNGDKATSCAVLTPALVAFLDRLRRLSQATALFEGIAHVEAREPDLDGRPGLFCQPANTAVDTVRLRGELSRRLGAVVGIGRPAADALQRVRIGQIRRRAIYTYVPVDGFLQVHAGVNELVVRTLVEGALERRLASFVDAYAGSGNHALALAAAGLRGVASETCASSLTGLRRGAREQGLAVQAVDGTATELASRHRLVGDAQLLVVNPPRAGAHRALPALLANAPKSVALLTCTTLALSRDLEVLRQSGYELESVVAFDMFPHTHHVETLCFVGRASRSEQPPGTDSASHETSTRLTSSLR